MNEIHLFLLGEFRLICADTPLTTLDRRLQSILAYLALHHATPQARNHLAFVLWPDSSEAQALTNLRNLLYKLRQALPDTGRILYIERQTIQWRPTMPWTLDVRDFEHALVQAEQAAQDQQRHLLRAALTQAVECYRDDLLPSWYEEWLLPERERLRQRLLQALERLLTLQEEERDYSEAIRTAQRLLRHDPLQETTYRHLMRLYSVSGDRAAALRTYHSCATTLERELAVTPSAATIEIYTRLLQIETLPAQGEAQLPGTRARAPLVGRRSEWVQLQATWQRVLAGHPQMVLLVGEAGMGKTRLAEELLSWVSRQGIITASACAYAAEGDLAYAPVAAWLRTDALQRHFSTLAETWLTEIARLVPEVLHSRPGLSSVGPLQESWQRQRFFEALAHAILGAGRPHLLVLDDLQWCDRDTLEWLHYLIRFDARAPLLLVGTLRPEEVIAEHPLATLLTSLRRSEQVTEISLGPFDDEETTILAAQIAGRALDPTWTALLYQETEGNPLFIVETVRLGNEFPKEQGQCLVDRAGMSSGPAIPPTVQAVITSRLESLSPSARTLASLAAIIGRSFTFPVLALARGTNEDDLVRDLDELWQRRIVREQGAEAYDFSHEKLREGASTMLSRARRRLLHQRVSEALATLYPDTLDQISGQIANHYIQAGLPHQAIDYLERAGDWASSLFAHTEAEPYYRELVKHLAELKREASLAQAQEKLARVLAVQARYREALDTLEVALAWYRTSHDLESQGRLMSMIGQFQADQGDTATGIALLTSWLADQPEGVISEQTQAFLLLTLTYLLLNSGRYSEALSTSQQALAFAQQGQNGQLLAQALWHVGRSLMPLGRTKEAFALFRTALPLAEQASDLRTQCYILLNLALVSETRGELNEVKHYTEMALPLARRWGAPPLLSFLLTSHGFAAFMQGEWQRSRQDYEEAIALLRQAKLPWGATYSLFNLSVQLLSEGQEEAGQAMLKEAMTLAEQTQDREALGMAQGILAEADLLLERPESVRERLEPLLQAEEAEEPRVISPLPHLAQAYLELGQNEQAQQLLDRILSWAREQQRRLILLNALPVQALLAAQHGKWEEAKHILEEALEIARIVPSRYDEPIILYTAGLISLQQGKSAQAHASFEAALTICHQLGERRYAARIKQALAICPSD